MTANSKNVFEGAWEYVWCDPLKEGIRLCICVLTFMIPLWVAEAQIGNHYYADAIRNGLEWAAVTCVVISQSLLGKASQVSFERTMGTIIGGSFAMAMLFTQQAGAVLALLGLTCVMATFLGGKFKLDYGGKLCCVTYIIVSGCVCRSISTIVSTWLSRSIGIICGVFLTLLVNMIVFPRSATNKAIQELRKAITSLSNMHESSWDIFMPPSSDSDVEDASERRRKDSETCEKAYIDAIASMRSIEDSIPITEDETILGSIFGQRILVPRWHWLVGKHDGSSFPSEECKSLATALRRSYRSQWALHMAMDDGFGLDLTLAFIAKYSSSGILDELRSSMKAFLDDLLNAFPPGYGEANVCIKGKEPVSVAGLERYSKALNDLMELSDAYYQQLMEKGRVDKMIEGASALSPKGKEKLPLDIPVGSVSVTIEDQSPARNEQVLPPPPDTPRSWQLSVASLIAAGKETEGDVDSIEISKASEAKPVAKGPPLQARLRWYSARFAMQCLLREALELASAANELLTNLPGREIKDGK